MKTMAKTGISYADWAWNPAPGCTKGCDGCWARACAKRNQHCELCRAFVPHLHEERLTQPENTKKGGVVAVNFMGELFDPVDKYSSHFATAWIQARRACQHTYLWLTQQPAQMLEAVSELDLMQAPNWYFGVTAKTQAELFQHYLAMRDFPSSFWWSLEPLHGPMILPALPHVSGVVIGCDRRGRIRCEIDWVREMVEQCRGRRIPVYVKQLNIDGKVTANIEDFPEDLRIRELPWGDKLQERTGI